MNYDDVISYFGSQTKVARRLGISQSAVARWRIDNGGRIPRMQQVMLRKITHGRLQPDQDVLEPGPSKPRGVRPERTTPVRPRRKPSAEPASPEQPAPDVDPAEACAS